MGANESLIKAGNFKYQTHLKYQKVVILRQIECKSIKKKESSTFFFENKANPIIPGIASSPPRNYDHGP